jgi:two-component system, chemotaxis family, protein-glutamate methylesterase/glutaminase
MSEQYVLNRPTALTCPECGGALAKIESDPIPKYACHIGHVLTGEAMLEAAADRIENYMTSVLAFLNEQRELCRQLMKEGLSDPTRLEATLREATANAETIRRLLNHQGSTPVSM